MSRIDHLPTSVRLTSRARTLLDDAVNATGQSRSQLVNRSVEAHIPTIIARAHKIPEERLAWLDGIVSVSARLGAGRSIEEIDASVREQRGDR